MSEDTIGNAYFMKLIHIIPNNFKNLAIITSDFHMPRSKAIFEFLYPKNQFKLTFISVPDILPEEILMERIEKEKKSLETWNNIIKDMSLEDFKKWIFTEHKCYCAGRNPERGKKMGY